MLPCMKLWRGALPIFSRSHATLQRPVEKLPVTELLQDKTLHDPDYFEVSKLFSIRDLFRARVHMGHKIGTLDERMKHYIYGHRLGVCIFDLDKTAVHLREALNFVAHTAYRNGVILFAGGDRAHIHLIERTALQAGEYAHVRTWRSGMLTGAANKTDIDLRYPDLLIMTSILSKPLEEHVALQEAGNMNIPIVAVVDSNCNPNRVAFPIPGNDDSTSSIELYLHLFKRAILLGKQRRKADAQ